MVRFSFLKVNVFYAEPNGDTIEEHEFDRHSPFLIPNVGDKVNIDGNYRKVTERAFSFGPKSTIVQITLEEI